MKGSVPVHSRVHDAAHKWRRYIVLMVVSALYAAAARGDEGVVGSPHDLSATGPGTVHALNEGQVCIFCHAAHNATGQSPLWNRFDPQTHYRIYESSTTDARIDQPSGPSKMCLSCHDGAMAIGLIASQPATEPIAMTRRTLPPGPSDLTEDLSDDHPIGFRYDRALAARDRQLKNPDMLTDNLPLGAHGEVHCTTCHDPHDNTLGDFLRAPTVRSAICLSCHELFGWDASSHANSPAAVRDRAVDSRERLQFHTVGDNGCASCHKIHSATRPEQLLRFRREEDNCLNCHSGGVARTNIESEFRKRSAHPVVLSDSRHEAGEDARVAPRHVECADCHNPHAVQPNESSAVARALGRIDSVPVPVDATMRFVSGVDRGGRAVDHSRFEYEVCFKCHADNASRGSGSDIVRQVHQLNTRLEFQPNNPSFHPVLGPRRNSDVVSLLEPYQVGSVLSCTDCHNSDSAGDGPLGLPAGPHGSIYEPLLVDNYETAEFVTESPRAYALCYRCHERESILGDESFSLHNIHVVRGRASCSACHDAHGISRTQGNDRAHSNLINFDLAQVRPVSQATGSRIVFEDRGLYRGSCTLTCHGVTHVGFEYGR